MSHDRLQVIYNVTTHELNIAMQPEFGLFIKQSVSLFFTAGRIDLYFSNSRLCSWQFVGHTTKRIIFSSIRFGKRIYQSLNQLFEHFKILFGMS